MSRMIKKNWPILLIGLSLLVSGYFIVIKPLLAVTTDQYHSSWHEIRADSNEDGASLAAIYNLTTDSAFSNKDTNSVASGGAFRIPSTGSPEFGEGTSIGTKWQFIICGKNYSVGADNAVDNTFSYSVLGWAKTNGPLQVIGHGTGILGTQAVGTFPDGTAANGVEVTAAACTYTHSTEVFVSPDAGFDGAVVEQVAYITGDANITAGYYAVTTYTDVCNMTFSGMSSSNNGKAITITMNPSFWADTLTLAKVTKWPGSLPDPNTPGGRTSGINVSNSGNNEIAIITIETTGIEWIQFVFYGCDGATGVEAGALRVYGRRW